jgi:catechol 2,3-dioxygenase-like lactoylglutathione lyase family enzyme
MPKAKIRHIAISTENPEEVAAWYRDVFGLEEVGRAPSGVYLSDGDVNFAVLRLRSAEDPDRVVRGVHHFGFMVDDGEPFYARLEGKGAKRLPQAPTTQQHFEVKYEGPDGQIVDVSEHGWVGSRPLAAKPSEGVSVERGLAST